MISGFLKSLALIASSLFGSKSHGRIGRTVWLSLAVLLLICNLFSWPQFSGVAKAANFTMQTGYYMGNGGTQAISGLGFQPQILIIKSDTAAGSAIFKTSSMPANTTAFFSATANNTSSLITFSTDGFSVANNANTNSANVRYTWTAFNGSDCTASGTVCTGTYTGNGTNPRLIATGFQPALALVKRSTAVAANFRTASMSSNVGNYFTTTAQDTGGGLFTTLVSNGFNVGASINNVNSGTYYYLAFKSVSGIMAEGTFTGDGLDNRSITGFGAGLTPNFAFVKNANSATTNDRRPYMNNDAAYGDYSSRLDAAAANAVNMIQRLQDDGIQVGSGVNVNRSGNTIYWVAFGGAAAPPTGNGSFEMAVGSYTGNGTSQSVSSLGFAPDLVIVKDEGANYAVFRTSLMIGDNTAYLANAVANITGGITSFDAGGFTVGSSASANSSGVVYHWQAFGNAYDPVAMSGASDFAIGAYIGNGIDGRDVINLPFQLDFVATKRNSTTAGTWRPSSLSGDLSSFFAATAEGSDRVQLFSGNGFQLGTNANVNSAGSVYYWFGFKNSSNFVVGTYSGTGSSQTISTGFQPNNVWIKRSTAVNGVMRASSLAGDATQYFANSANATGRVTAFASNGFTLGTQTETNASGGTYRYAAWRIPPENTLYVDIVDSGGSTVSSPSVAFSSLNASFDCQTSTGSLGISSQKIRVNNGTTNDSWTLSMAATAGSTASWSNGSNTYDYNDSAGTPTGCSDGADSDGLSGQQSIDASGGTISPGGGCSGSGITKGSGTAFLEGSVNSITLLSASGSQTDCYYDLTGVSISQKVPAEVPADASQYTINMTLTVVAN